MTTPSEVLDRIAALAEKATPILSKRFTSYDSEAMSALRDACKPETVLALVAAVQAGMDLRSSPASYCGSRYDERQVSHEDVDAFDRAIAALAAPSEGAGA